MNGKERRGRKGEKKKSRKYNSNLTHSLMKRDGGVKWGKLRERERINERKLKRRKNGKKEKKGRKEKWKKYRKYKKSILTQPTDLNFPNRDGKAKWEEKNEKRKRNERKLKRGGKKGNK